MDGWGSPNPVPHLSLPLLATGRGRGRRGGRRGRGVLGGLARADAAALIGDAGFGSEVGFGAHEAAFAAHAATSAAPSAVGFDPDEVMEGEPEADGKQPGPLFPAVRGAAPAVCLHAWAQLEKRVSEARVCW